MKKSLLIAFFMVLFSACDDNSTFVDKGEALQACDRVQLFKGDKAVATTAKAEDTQVLISHNVDGSKTLEVLKGEVKIIRAQ